MDQFFANFRADAADIRERMARNAAGGLRAPGDAWIDNIEALVRAGAEARLGYADDLPGADTGLRGACGSTAYMQTMATHSPHPLAARWEASIDRLRVYFSAAVMHADGPTAAPWPTL